MEVTWIPELPCGSQASASRIGRKFDVELSWRRLRGSWALCNDAIIHEWAHCATWQEHRDLGDHPPEFWIEYGRLYVLWFEEGGCEEAKSYDFRKVRIR